MFRKSGSPHRITPRTCLWPLAISLVVTFGLSIGLTFRSNHHCYAGTCGEWLFPLQARLHVVIWYAWLSLSITFLAIRAFHPEMGKVLAKPLTKRKLPLLGKDISVGGAIILFGLSCCTVLSSVSGGAGCMSTLCAGTQTLEYFMEAVGLQQSP